MIFTVLHPSIPVNYLASRRSTTLIFFVKERGESWRPIANCSAIFSNNNQALEPFRQSGAPHHFRDCPATAVETPTIFSSACDPNSIRQQSQDASSKCPIIFASAWV